MAESSTSAALRVALLDSIPTWGGGEKWCLDAATALRARGHFVAIACASGGALAERSSSAGIVTWPLRIGGWRNLAAALELGAHLEREHIDVVVANIGRDVRLGAVACARSRAELVQRRGIARKLKRDPLTRMIYRRSVRRVIANCAAIRDEMLGDGSVIGPERFVVIENGIELRDAGERGRARTRHAIAADAPLALVVGRLAPMKGHEHLLRAWPRVLERVPRARLMLAGDGESGPRLRALAGELGIDASVVFTGFLRDLADPYAAADVFVLPSVRDEGCNNALLESMARGLPAVVTDCGGLPESVVHGETGLVVPPADAPALADALARLLADPALRSTFGRAARRRAGERYSIARVTAELERVLRSVRDGAR